MEKILYLAYAFSIIVVSILAVGVLIQGKSNNSTSKSFLNLIFSVIGYLLANLISEILDGNTKLIFLTYIVNVLTFICVDIIMIFFTNYLFSVLKSKGNVKDIWKKLIYIFCTLRIIVVIILTICGELFVINEYGQYTEIERLDIIPYMMSIIAETCLIAATIVNKKKLTNHQFVVIMLYQVVPVISVVLELFLNVYIVLGLALTISCLIIYVLLQNTYIESEKIRANVLEEISNNDILTGMKNRRSYYNLINSINKEELIGVIFLDINGLKYTNDHYGHAAGDELIKKFANIIFDVFGKEDAYRISGDEFVVVYQTSHENIFMQKVFELQNKIYENKNIAALGMAYGKALKFESLIVEAEDKMYIDKSKNGRSRK